METDLCSLKWRNRMEHLQSTYLEFFQKELFCDVTLVAGKDRFKAHILVLSSFSPYFKDMLTSITPGQHPVIFLKETTSQEVKWLLDYLYQGEVVIPVDLVEQFISFGESLGVSGLDPSQNQDCTSSSDNFITPGNSSEIVVEPNQSNPSLTPELASPIITSHIKIPPNKRYREISQIKDGNKRSKTDIGSEEKELNKVGLSVQEELHSTFNSEEFGSISFFDDSNILDSPPRSPSVIFDLGNYIERVTPNETQASVIFQEDEENEEIVEISDDQSQVVAVPNQSPIVNQTQEDGRPNQQSAIHLDALENDQSQVVAVPNQSPIVNLNQDGRPNHQSAIQLNALEQESDDSEIIIVRREYSHRTLGDTSKLNVTKELKVVLNRCSEDS